jgi:hypothetical protein
MRELAIAVAIAVIAGMIQQIAAELGHGLACALHLFCGPS